MPLIAVSLLASCNKGGGDEPTPEEYTLTITLNNCKIGEESTKYTKTYVKGAMIDATKASVAIETAVQITTRAVNAYKEITQMQI